MSAQQQLAQVLEMIEGFDFDPASEEYKQLLTQLLHRLDPRRPVGTALCDAIMRLWPTSAMEAVLFRENRDRQLQIYLRCRAPDDTAYPGEWHAPGSLYRTGEQDEDVARRLGNEFGATISTLKYVDRIITAEARGTVHSFIFLVQVEGEARLDDRHSWFLVGKLPDQTVNAHRELIIPKAIAAYKNSKPKRL